MPYLNQAGNYDCVVLHAENWIGGGEIRADGTQSSLFIALPLEVTDGPCAGQHITSKHYLSEKAFDRTIETLADAFGWDGDLNALASGMFSFADLQCSITTELESYTNDKGESKQACKVAWLNPLGGGARWIKPADTNLLDDLVKNMGSRSKALAAAARQGKRAPAPRQTATATATVSQDDLPF